MNLEEIKEDLEVIFDDLVEQFDQADQSNKLLVLGCSSSEILGKHIGKGSSQEVGELVIKSLIQKLEQTDYHLAVQGCEHINRSLIIEREDALRFNYELVNVVPVLNAGGSAAVAAYKYFKDPVVVEHIVAQAGIDIGDTSIGMHVKYVQVPVRPKLKSVGEAHVTALVSRPKYVGGPRAHYLD